jgi:hypothetical protein
MKRAQNSRTCAPKSRHFIYFFNNPHPIINNTLPPEMLVVATELILLQGVCLHCPIKLITIGASFVS